MEKLVPMKHSYENMFKTQNFLIFMLHIEAANDNMWHLLAEIVIRTAIYYWRAILLIVYIPEFSI